MVNSALQISSLVGFLVSLSTLAFWFGILQRSQQEAVTERMQTSERQQVPEDLEMEQPFSERVIKPAIRKLIRRLGHLMPRRDIQRLQRNLEGAGRPHELTVSDFLGISVLATLISSGAAISLLRAGGAPATKVLLLGLGAGVVGFLYPRFWLRRHIRDRQNEIQRALPDALDMLTIAVTAGLGFDGAMQVINQKWDNALSQEFGKVLREMQVGIPRSEALRNMAQRVNVTEMSQFVAVLVQADQMGLSISKVLEAQSQQMRMLRRQRAEELAQQAPVKMLFPLIFLIFPSIFVVILGPAVPVLLEIFS